MIIRVLITIRGTIINLVFVAHDHDTLAFIGQSDYSWDYLLLIKVLTLDIRLTNFPLTLAASSLDPPKGGFVATGQKEESDVLRARNRSSERIATALTRRMETGCVSLKTRKRWRDLRCTVEEVSKAEEHHGAENLSGGRGNIFGGAELRPCFLANVVRAARRRIDDRGVIVYKGDISQSAIRAAIPTSLPFIMRRLATHDILNYGIWDIVFPNKSGGLLLKDHYDHFTFTGPVPRTFVGALALAGASWPFTKLFGDTANQQIIGLSCQSLSLQMRMLILPPPVRAVLGLWNAMCLLYYRNSVAKAFGRGTANWFALFQASGFHLIYYASRTLPNFFAFGLVTIAFARLLSRTKPSADGPNNGPQTFLAIITIAGIVFRSELVLLLIPNTALLIILRSLTLTSVLISGLTGAIIGLSLTVPIDSLFWQRFPLWPELSAFSYNILHSQSSKWGTSPWHFYFTSALPRLLFNPITYIICIPVGISQPALRRPLAELIFPNLFFVALYSFQPHKEWRFIVYVIPPFLTAAALGANWIWTRRAKMMVNRVLSLVLVASVVTSFSASIFMLGVSRLNYPGAEALNRLHTLVPLHAIRYPNENNAGAVKVHMDTLACMTGVTRFLQLPPPPLPDVLTLAKNAPSGLFWIYDKTEDEEQLLDPLFWERFDWVLAERPERVIGRWEIVETVDGYGGLRVLKPGDEIGEEERATRSISDAWTLLKQGQWKGLMDVVERYGRIVTRGWWIGIRMEPRIRILREKEVIGMRMGGDW
ncbi:MAG: hypothetical protein Q9216_003734 [Gyalolechia sp. 2 TL-2023]